MREGNHGAMIGKAMMILIPPSVLAIADEVIE